MNELFDISILAESENGFIEIIFFVVVAGLGIIGSVVTNLNKKRQEREEQQRLLELRDEARAEDAEDNDEWTHVVEQVFDRDRLELIPAAARPARIPPVQPKSAAVIHTTTKSMPDRPAAPRDHSAGASDLSQLRQRAGAIRLDTTTARKAIIFHEILSPPKALRENCELWD